MIQEEYSLYKLVHFPHVMEMIRRGDQPPPIQVHLIPTNRCNQDCAICAYRRDGYQSNQNFNPRDELPWPQLERLLSDLAIMGTRAVQITGGGEPLLHPQIIDVMRLVKDLGMRLALVTNGTLFNPEVQEAVEGASWTRFSLDAATAGTYARVKNTSKTFFDKVANNIGRFTANKGATVVGIGFVVQEHNHHEIFEATRLARDLGVDNIRISAAFTPMGVRYFDRFREDACLEARAAATEFQTENFKVFNLFDERIGELFSGRQGYPYCHYKDIVPYIGADGNVYSCCVKAYTDSGLMGSIQPNGFREFWLSRGKQTRYAGHDPRAMCPHPCMFERKNEFINYCALAEPRHVEFI